MAQRAFERIKIDAVSRVVEMIHRRLPSENVATALTFVERLYANVPPDDIAAEDAETLYGAAVSFLRFGRQRPAGRPLVRVFNPNINEDGWRSTHTIVEIVNDDMPFLVDSVTAELNRRDLTVHLVVHPILRVERDADGELVRIVTAEESGDAAESWMQISIDERTGPDELKDIADSVATVLGDVRAAVRDWRTMRDRNAALIEELARNPPADVDREEVAEAADFLAWVDDDHFTYLGYREYRFEGDERGVRAIPVPETGLGILREERRHSPGSPAGLEALPETVLPPLLEPHVLVVTKANTRSTVHRPTPMDYVGVQIFDEGGRVVGERRFVGLFTSVVYNTSPRRIPILRRKVAACVERSGHVPNSHDEKALLHILETFPRDELFQSSVDELHDIANGILHLQERQRITLFMRADRFERFVSCLVYVPRDRYDTTFRLRAAEILTEGLRGEVSAVHTQMGDDPLARIHFVIRTTPGELPEYDPVDLERRIAEAGRTWADRLHAALVQEFGEERGVTLFRRYATGFSPAYRDTYLAEAAIQDIAIAEREVAAEDLGMNLFRPVEGRPNEVRFKLYHPGAPVPLSDILPMLETMGFKVIGEVPFEVRPAGRGRLWIHDFAMEDRGGVAIDLRAMRERFQECFARLWRGEIESDGLNALVVAAGLDWRQVVVVRALSRYLRQVGIQFSQDYMAETLVRHPDLACDLVRLFEARFDPDGPPEPADDIRERIRTALETVESLDEDRILRRFLDLIEGALRTNHWQVTDDGTPKPYLAIKLDSRRLDELPLPRPLYEIWVYSARMEGVHLRAGKVARGGIRWSDRREDFRTEILGLMKAQHVKNTVIVPVGAKGGFVVKQPPAEGGRDAALEEGIACYRTLIRGMLDLTDNRAGETIEPPPRLVRHDDDDPYIVAAADKGTATFSDIANGVSEEYGFWLGDAFASGGSAGYDHKGMGITARGAWESVKRHFRELGHDTQSEDFTVAGVGDMSGDVFGNAMLLSRHIRLIGAFNHLHVFVDPDPDPETSFRERERLFALPRSSWSDYDTTLISKGGGVFDRKAKSIDLTPEIRQAFGIEETRITPAQLIRAILLAQVDLLFFGGIGTFVKAADETHAEVGDRGNDTLRVDGERLRARVVGEGANLGVTQRGRIAYALAGGYINTDFIDNSAGVDTSDHEVNIKILLGQAVADGDMTRKQRDALLADMTDEVASLVLRDNYLQGQAISLAEQDAPARVAEHARFVRVLERSGRLDRAVEGLPDEEEFAEREAAHLGLTRPELAILLSYAKLQLYDDILESALPDDPHLRDELVGYFPTPLRERFGQQIERHGLAREIVTMLVTNGLVDRAGITFVERMKERTGHGAADVASAFEVAVTAFELHRTWGEIEGLDNRAPARLQYRMLLETRTLLHWAAQWFLRNRPEGIDVAGALGEFGPGIESLCRNLPELLDEAGRAEMDRRVEELEQEGAPEALARRVAGIPFLRSAPDIVAVAATTGVDVNDAAHLYYEAGARFHLDWARAAARTVVPANAWDRQAIETFVEDFMGHQARLTAHCLGEASGIDAWTAAHRSAVDRLDRLVTELQAAGHVEIAMLTVYNGHMRALLSV